MTKRLAIMMMVAGAVCGQVGAVDSIYDSDIVFTVSGDMGTAYINKGRTFNDGWVFQPSVDVSRRLFNDQGWVGFYFWGNMDLSEYHGTRQYNEFSEIDLSTYWKGTFFDIDWRLQYTQYLYPYLQSYDPEPGVPVTHEVLMGAERKFRERIGVGGSVAFDYNERWSMYGMAYSYYVCMITDVLTLTPRVSMGAAEKRMAESFGGTHAGFADYEFRLAGNYIINDKLRINGRIGYVGTLNTETLPAERYGGVDVKLYALIGLSYDM